MRFNNGGTMLNRVLQLTLTGIMLASCAQEKPFEESSSKKHLLKSGQLYSKKDANFCTEKSPCLYVPSVADTPMNVTASRPYWQGDQKLVVTRCDTENKSINHSQVCDALEELTEHDLVTTNDTATYQLTESARRALSARQAWQASTLTTSEGEHK